jgi:hypothetical protein
VDQLASRGLISAFPDNAYRGGQSVTRYETAAFIARALAGVDMENATAEDVELLKKLVTEFKDELNTIGFKAEKIDSSLKNLENDIGGWKISGELLFDAKFTQDNDKNGWYSDFEGTIAGKNEFDLRGYRMYLSKKINETASFSTRLGLGPVLQNNTSPEMFWELYYVSIKLPGNSTLIVGRDEVDWEREMGLIQGDNYAWFGDWWHNQIRFEKTWGATNFKIIIGRNNDGGMKGSDDSIVPVEQFTLQANLDHSFNEKFRAGLLGYGFLTDSEATLEEGFETDTDLFTYGIYAMYDITHGIAIKGALYAQKQGDSLAAVTGDDSATAWRALVDIKQDVLKFTSLWLEYGQIDNSMIWNSRLISMNHPFWIRPPYMGAYSYSRAGAELSHNQPYGEGTSIIAGIHASQQWSEKLRTYERFYYMDFDNDRVDDANSWSVGIAYRYSPAIEFDLSYNVIDYGYGELNDRNGDDSLVRFRTHVFF